ncbi:hypothetical protein PENTCL1PPCAC_7546, partial [Pristionchus entomophagus]
SPPSRSADSSTMTETVDEMRDDIFHICMGLITKEWNQEKADEAVKKLGILQKRKAESLPPKAKAAMDFNMAFVEALARRIKERNAEGRREGETADGARAAFQKVAEKVYGRATQATEQNSAAGSHDDLSRQMLAALKKATAPPDNRTSSAGKRDTVVIMIKKKADGGGGGDKNARDKGADKPPTGAAKAPEKDRVAGAPSHQKPDATDSAAKPEKHSSAGAHTTVPTVRCGTIGTEEKSTGGDKNDHNRNTNKAAGARYPAYQSLASLGGKDKASATKASIEKFVAGINILYKNRALRNAVFVNAQ